MCVVFVLTHGIMRPPTPQALNSTVLFGCTDAEYDDEDGSINYSMESGRSTVHNNHNYSYYNNHSHDLS